jgi:hypothetical protein
MGGGSHVAAMLLLFGVTTADAQVTTPPPVSGAYQKLSAGNQKVARALFEAQTMPMSAATTKAASKPAPASPATSSATAKTLTLDQIAAMKQQGTGWEHVFRQMRAQGLLTDKNIGQVMTRYNESRTPSASVMSTRRAGAPSSSEASGRAGNLR